MLTAVLALSADIAFAQTGAVITAFAPLNNNIRYQRTTSPQLPQTVIAAVNGTAASVPVTWSADGYAGPMIEPGLYVFFAKLSNPSYTIVQNVSAPKITVMLQAAAPAKPAGSGIGIMGMSMTAAPAAEIGTEDAPILISNAAQLAEIAELTNAGMLELFITGKSDDAVHFRMTENISLSTYGKDTWFNGGKGWIPVGKSAANPFRSVFDGDNNIISGFYINDNALGNSDSDALFGNVAGAGTVRNVGFRDPSVNGEDGRGVDPNRIAAGSLAAGATAEDNFVINREVSDLLIHTQPSNLANYTHGDALDLTGLIVTIVYDDGTTEDAAFADFASNHITTEPADNTALVHLTHNNQPVTVTYDNNTVVTANTNNLTVARKNIADATVTVGGSYVYTGSPHTPQTDVLTVTLAGFVPLTYSIRGYSDNINASTPAAPAAVNIEGTGNFTGTASGTFTIAKANSVYPMPQRLTANYLDVLSNVALPPNWVWDSPADAVGGAGERQHSATFTQSINHNPVTRNLTVYVNRISQSGFAIVNPGTITYGDASFVLTVAGGNGSGTVTWALTAGGAVTVNSATGAVTIVRSTMLTNVTVTATKAGNENYNTATATVTFPVEKRNLNHADVSAAVTGTYIYTGLRHTPSPTVTDAGAYANITVDDFTYTHGANTNAGTATVTISATSDGNYTGTRTVNFNIGKAPLTVNADNKEKTLVNPVIPPFTYTISGFVNAETEAALRSNNALGGTPGIITNYEVGDVADNYKIVITIGTLVADNYEFTVFNNAALSVGLAAQTTGFAINDPSPVTYGDAPFTLTAGGGEHIGSGTITWTVTGGDGAVTVNPTTGLVTIDHAGTSTITATKSILGFIPAIAQLPLTILPRPIDTSGITITIPNVIYNGDTRLPTITITDVNPNVHNATLNYSTHYEHDFTALYTQPPTNAGDYYFTITGKGNYTGTSNQTFTINRADLTSLSLSTANGETSFPYGTASVPLSLYGNYGGGTVTYSSSNSDTISVNASTGAVTFNGVGRATITANIAESQNYNAGSVTRTLEVTPRPFDQNVVITPNPIEIVSFTGTQHTPDMTVTDGVVPLTIGVDYEIAYGANVNAGVDSGIVIITPRGNYGGIPVERRFTIDKATPVVSAPPAASEVYYLDLLTTSMFLDGGTVTGADGVTLTGSWAWTSANPLMECGSHTATFTVSGTPESTNYNTVNAVVHVAVNGSPSRPFLIINGEEQLRMVGRGTLNPLNYHHWTAHRFYKLELQPSEDGITLILGDWVPIPGEFTGGFDGNGKFIRNMRINIPSNTAAGLNVGMFRSISGNGRVHDLWLDSVRFNITTAATNPGIFIGSIAGRMSDSATVSNCRVVIDAINFSTGATHENNHRSGVGGIVGRIESASVIVSNSSVTGGPINLRFTSSTTSSILSQNIGGIVGANGNTGSSNYVDHGGLIENCYTNVTVSGRRTNGTVVAGQGIGGIAGRNDGTIRNCYALGMVEGGADVGGIAGNNFKTIENCLALNQSVRSGGYMGRVSGIAFDRRAQKLKNNRAWSSMSISKNSAAISALLDCPIVSHIDPAGNFDGCDRDGDNLSFAVDGLDISIADIKKLDIWGEAHPNGAAFNFTTPWKWDNTGANAPTLFTENNPWPDHLTNDASPSMALIPMDFSLAPVPSQWHTCGTSSDPCTITTAEELAGLAIAVRDNESNTVALYADNYYVLANDIDLSRYNNPQHQWVPIGTDANPFRGNFSGEGYAVIGLHINDNTLEDAGLFGVVDGGIIENAGLVQISISAGDNVGGIAGRLINGSISDVYVTGSISGSENTGGIAGALHAHGASSAISNVYSTASITGDNNIGGLAGYVDGGAINNSAALGAVVGARLIAPAHAGRVIGYLTNNAALENNHAFIRMTDANGDTLSWTASGKVNDGIHGVNINGTTAVNPDFWTSSSPSFPSLISFESLNWNTNKWHIVDGKLPILKGPATTQDGGAPLYLRDRNIIFINVESPLERTRTGEEITPNLTWGEGSSLEHLVKGVDYTIEFTGSNGTDAGSGTFILTGIGNYTGVTSPHPFKIDLPKPAKLIPADNGNDNIAMNMFGGYLTPGFTAQAMRVMAADNLGNPLVDTSVIISIAITIHGYTVNRDIYTDPATSIAAYNLVIADADNGTEIPFGLIMTLENGRMIYEECKFIVSKPPVSMPPPDVSQNNNPQDAAPAVLQRSMLPAFTAGPNPVARSSGRVDFFYTNGMIRGGTLNIYDVMGNAVNKINVNDNRITAGSTHRIASWDLKDTRSRKVPEGTYLIRGSIITADGKRERVKLLVGVR